jgi:hypothetical protein
MVVVEERGKFGRKERRKRASGEGFASEPAVDGGVLPEGEVE